MSCIKFSIIVPIYNVEKYIDRCICSLIYQNYSNLEIILVDDGSFDDCPLICDNYAMKDSRIKVFHKNNGGLSDARNYGLEKSKGDYIIFVDSDDYIDKNACVKFNEIIGMHKKIDIVAANIKRFGNKFVRLEKYTELKDISKGSEFLKFQLKNNSMFAPVWRNIYRREFLIKNQLYFKFGILHEDEQWTPRVFLIAESVITTDYVFYFYCYREGSINESKIKTKNAIDIISTCNELKEIYKNIEDNELKLLLMDYLAYLYLYGVYIGKLWRNKHKFIIDKKFFQELGCTNKFEYEIKLFCLNKQIYCCYCYLWGSFRSFSNRSGSDAKEID